MIKILALSDIYGELDIVEELVEKYNERFDIGIISGGINNPKKNVSTKIFEKLLKLSEKILFVNGGTDKINFEKNFKIHNLEIEPVILTKDNLKIGFLGLGGVPDRSIKKEIEYPNIWNESVWFDNILRKINVHYNKLTLEHPDIFFFISHSPPYGIADYSKKITLNELESLQEIEEQDTEEKKKSSNPVHLGSKIIREFISNNRIDIHIFGHVQKEGGKIIQNKDTTFINVAHLSSSPYKLTGRKFCIIKIENNNIDINFEHVVDSKLDFENFLIEYL